jgi:glycosyltransferase involved in cell wall biosynthesis
MHEIFGRLARRGHRVTALVSGWPGAAPRAELDGLTVHRTGSRHTFNLWAPLAYHRLRERFDLVVEDLNKVPVFTPFWVRRPVVLLVHHLFGTTAWEQAGPVMASATWLLERPLAPVYRRVPVEAVSESTAEDLVARGFRRERIEVIPNGVDLESFPCGTEAERFPEPTLLYLGRLERYKRVDLILRAVARLTAMGVPARFIIAGQGPAAPALEGLRSELGLGARVELHGFVSEEEKRRLMRRSWVHVLTSAKEGWGITVLEAGACGTPTVASDSPGLRDSVIPGETGLLVPHGDVEALASALRSLVLDANLRQRLGRQARVFAMEHTWERSADRTEAHLAAVLRTGPRPAGHATT